MPSKNFIEDVATLTTGILSSLASSRHELKAQARQRAGALMREFDVVTREEFDAAFAMLAKTRTMQEEIAARLGRIESHLGLLKSKPGTSETVKMKNRNLPSVKTKMSARGGKTTAKTR